MERGQTVYKGGAWTSHYSNGPMHYVTTGVATGVEADGKHVIRVSYAHATAELRADDGTWRTTRGEALEDCKRLIREIKEDADKKFEQKLAEIDAEINGTEVEVAA